MSIQSGRAVLESANKDLHIRWKRVGEYWNDSVRADFERSHLDPLDRKIKSALGSIEEIATLLARARRECG